MRVRFLPDRPEFGALAHWQSDSLNDMKYTKASLAPAVAQSNSFAGVIRSLGLRVGGGTQRHVSEKVKEFGLDTSHFTGQAHGRGGRIARLTADDVLRNRGRSEGREKTHILRRAMLESGIPHICGECGAEPVWRGKAMVLEVDHIDGDNSNDERRNLRFLCPNCHSQQPTNKPWRLARQ
jgi:hypothetical protein